MKIRAVLHRFDRVGDLDQLAGGDFRVGVGAGLGEFHFMILREGFLAFAAFAFFLRLTGGSALLTMPRISRRTL